MATTRPGGTVLVVDDDADIRAMIAQALELEGWRVLEAANGAEALHLLRGGDVPGVILLDIMMPVVNGWQFIEQQRRNPTWTGIPVVLISGDERLPEKALAAGVAGYLRKPMDLIALLDTVTRHHAPQAS
jgi:two-component system chemotaxis response regulator CheY